MTCGEFERIVPELARRRLNDAAQVRAAGEHATGCPRCEARLNGERELQASLGFLRDSVPREAPAGVEARLRGSLRKHRRAQAARRWYWAAAAAVCAMGILSFALARSAREAGRAAPAARDVRRAESAAQLALHPSPVKAGSAAVASNGIAAGQGRGARHLAQAARQLRLTAKAEPERGAQAATARQNAVRRRGFARPAIDSRPVRRQEEEIMTGFLPVSWGAASTGYASIVRLKVSRSSLPSYGLPVNPDAAAGWVQADVLVGEDGVARAIRFIR